MEPLREALVAVESQQKTLDVYAAEETRVSELTAQFSTRNVRVTHQPMPSGTDREFIVIRNPAGEFCGALGLNHLQSLLSPEIHPPWTLADSDVNLAEVLDFLDNTLFSSYDRRQMLAVTREIEERAWRANCGLLYVGFQNSTALAAQTPVYNRFARESALTVRVFIEDELEGSPERVLDETVDVISASGTEIGQFWFVLFDGGQSEQNACGLLAEEREPDHYYGFWTFDPGRIDALITSLETVYNGR